MTELEHQGYKATSVLLVPASDNKITIDGLNGPVNITFAAVMLDLTKLTTVTVGNVDDVSQGTAKAWTFPALVDGVSCINIAGFNWKYIWFTTGSSTDTNVGTVTAFTKDRKPPANTTTYKELTP